MGMEAIRIHRHLDSQLLDLPELAPLLGSDVEIIVLATAVPAAGTAGPIRRRAGSAKGQIKMADDFDAPLDAFAEYRP